MTSLSGETLAQGIVPWGAFDHLPDDIKEEVDFSPNPPVQLEEMSSVGFEDLLDANEVVNKEQEESPEFRKALRREVSRVLRTLSEGEQIVIRLMYMRVKGLSEAEVASKMNITEEEVVVIRNLAFSHIFERFSQELAIRFIDGQQ